jgi:hypothetical protein
MGQLSRKLLSVLGSGAVAAMFMASGVTNAAAAANATCNGGSVAAGTYTSLTVTGVCFVNSGNVTVTQNLTIAPGGGVNAAFFGSNLTVGHQLLIQSGALLVLGCEPFAFPCFNDPKANQGGTLGIQTNDSVGHNLVSSGATLVLVHHSTISGNVVQTGGGGGLPCVELFPNGPPPYTTYEDNTIGGNVTVTGLQTCWDGFFRNNVAGNVNWNNNVTWNGHVPDNPPVDGDEDGNEISGNIVQGNLNCFGNFPAAQFGDSAGVPNTVSGATRGQCTALV